MLPHFKPCCKISFSWAGGVLRRDLDSILTCFLMVFVPQNTQSRENVAYVSVFLQSVDALRTNMYRQKLKKIKKRVICVCVCVCASRSFANVM